MPKIATDYSTREVSFYKFTCNNPEIQSTYVGSTVDFIKRKCQHKHCCNKSNHKDYNLKIYQMIRENGGWDEWRMIEIEKRIVKDKREAERIEQEWIEKLQADMNSYRAFGKKDMTEYFEEHREEKNEKSRLKYIEKKELISKILLHSQEKKKKEKEEKKVYDKQYRLDNKEKRIEIQRQWRLKKKSILS